jgi:hypothetical protein
MPRPTTALKPSKPPTSKRRKRRKIAENSPDQFPGFLLGTMFHEVVMSPRILERLKGAFTWTSKPEKRIEDNPFYIIVMNDTLSSEEKQKHIAAMLVMGSAGFPPNRLDEFVEFKMYLKNRREALVGEQAESLRQLQATVNALSGGGLDRPMVIKRPLQLRLGTKPQT